MTKSPQERCFTTSGLTYAALCWGDPGQPIVVALHGWLDNALSFGELAAHFSGYYLVAIDLSGHGLSSHRSIDSSYHIWDDLPQLMDIVDELTDEAITLIGHSRGATVAILLACALGARCSSLALIDGLLPAWGDEQNGAHQLRRFVEQRRKYMQRDIRFFASIEDFAERRKQYGFTTDSAWALASRALEKTEKGWRLRNDPRLFAASAVYINQSQRQQIYRQLTVPVLSIIASHGLLAGEGVAQRMFSEASSCLPNFSSTTIDGSHHLHMEEQAALLVAQRILQFMADQT